MSFEEFEKALESLEFVSGFSASDLKNRYLKLSRKYHPDMPDGSDEKFREVNEAYKLLQEYVKHYRFGIDEKDFYKQNPFSKKSGDWFYDF